MAAPLSASSFEIGPAKFAQARSAWLDSFSKLEIAVRKFELRCCGGLTQRGISLKSRLPAMMTSCSSPAVGLPDLQKLVRECEALLPLRATIVHSVMKIELRGSEEVATFQNVYDAAEGIPICATMTQGEFERGGNNLRRLAKLFEKLGPNPSAPPRPSPASRSASSRRRACHAGWAATAHGTAAATSASPS